MLALFASCSANEVELTLHLCRESDNEAENRRYFPSSFLHVSATWRARIRCLERKALPIKGFLTIAVGRREGGLERDQHQKKTGDNVPAGEREAGESPGRLVTPHYPRLGEAL